jgi:RHS repeat-associated protein
VWRWDQAEPFGNNPADEDPDANSVAFDLPLRLPGQRYDAETGLHYNYFRDFDPNLGIYKQSDLIGLRGGLNTYAYVNGDPLSWTDPFGLFKYNAPPPRTVPVNPATEVQVKCIENCIGIQLVITGGAETGAHAPPSRGGRHHVGEAVDFGTGANPSIDPRSFPKPNVNKCACECGFTHGGWEPDWIPSSAPHYHFQNGAGAGVPKLNCNMCRP